MSAPKPKQQIEDLTNRIVDMIGTNHTFQTMDLLRLRKDANKLLTSNAANPAHCHMCIGLIEFMARNREECIARFKNAIALAPSDDTIYKNFLLVYSDFGCFNEVVEFAEDVVARFSGTKSVFITVMVELFNMLQLSKFECYFEQYKKLNLDFQNEIPEKLVKGISIMKNMFLENDISEVHLLKLLNTAVRTLRNAGFEVVRTNLIMLSDGTAMHHMYIDADVDVCAENNFLIADSLVEEYEDTAMSYLSIVCRPLSHRTKNDLLLLG